MFRSNESSARAQMSRCRDCDVIMDAIYSHEARDLCWDCGKGVIKHVSELFEETA